MKLLLKPSFILGNLAISFSIVFYFDFKTMISSLLQNQIFIGLGIFAAIVIWQYLSLKNEWIELHEDGLFIHRGILGKSKSTLLYSQIQDLKEVQGPFDKLFHIKSLSIVTMSGLSVA